MSAQGVHKITSELEAELAKYTGAPYCVCVDNASNALFLSLVYTGVKDTEIEIPSHTYMSVPCEIIHAGAKVKFIPSAPYLNGAYYLNPTKVIDSALRFTADMYIPGTFMCLSFTGPYKHFKLNKGGAILTDNKDAYEWFKKARFSGRSECSYHEDNFDENPVIGWNFYMMPEIATQGLHMIPSLYNEDGSKKSQADLELKYPDLSKFNLWK
jgi:dTDP-4-amino-4,6-dideoxygalactose transaminase